MFLVRGKRHEDSGAVLDPIRLRNKSHQAPRFNSARQLPRGITYIPQQHPSSIRDVWHIFYFRNVAIDIPQLLITIPILTPQMLCNFNSARLQCLRRESCARFFTVLLFISQHRPTQIQLRSKMIIPTHIPKRIILRQRGFDAPGHRSHPVCCFDARSVTRTTMTRFVAESWHVRESTII